MKTQVSNSVNVETAELLKTVLADQFVLYTKARNYHWNVTGGHFYRLHEIFEKLYDELAEDIDEVAERIRALGVNAPGTLSEFLRLSQIGETENYYPAAEEMVRTFTNDYELVTNRIIENAIKIQDEFRDEITAGLLYGLAQKYQKNLWMLKSLINN
ncbi:Dps family protein [Melioribacter sp. OK-6-Me]|uniref:Dps family protein n=1 Tax=unclassified Melioribacter TaxID=2627329 RepID=UPI003EDAE2F2